MNNRDDGTDGQHARQGVHPFCGSCTDETMAWHAPDTRTFNGIGTRFYGAESPCPHCGSVIRQLYFCVLWIPLKPMGRFRIITLSRSLTGSSTRYVGRRFPDSGADPDRLGRKTAALVAQATAMAEQAQRSWPEPPPSRLAEHPGLRGERYRRAEEHWRSGRADRALPLYETVLVAHEKVLAADDTATLQLRQRVAEAYLAVGRPAAALALFEQTHAHLRRVRGPRHPDTNRAIGDLRNARGQLGKLGLPAEQAEGLLAELTELECTVGPDHPAALRTACALGDALHSTAMVAALDSLTETLDRSAHTLGADHPDTGHVRDTLVRICGLAEGRGKPDEVEAAIRARDHAEGQRDSGA